MRDGRVRDQLFIEGLRLAEEAISANLKVTDYFFTGEFAKNPRGACLLEKIDRPRGALISAKLLESIADTESPQGIIVLAERPQTGAPSLDKVINGSSNQSASEEINDHPSAKASAVPLLVILHKLNNPNNVGAILRAAEAAGCTGAIMTANSADPFAPKSLRAAMGSAFRLPLWTHAGFVEAIEFCQARGIKAVCAELGAIKTHVEVDWTLATAVVVGSEAYGLLPEEIRLCDESLRIPMNAAVESLNAAVAAAIVLYEAHRQRSEFQVSGSKFQV